MSDGDALMAAIVSHPDEHTPRLIYADWLTENGDPDRAEFVRVQCEIASGDSLFQTYPETIQRSAWQNGRRSDLLLRQCVLLATHRNEWLSAGTCPKCEGKGVKVLVERCPHCWGTGHVGGLLREFSYEYDGNPEPLRINWGRYPLLQLEVPELLHLEDGFQFAQGSRSLPTPWLAAVVRHWPTVVSCVPLDREPAENPAFDMPWFWLREYPDIPLQRHHLAANLFDGLEGGTRHRVLDAISMGYATRTDAVAALGRAVVRWARSFIS